MVLQNTGKYRSERNSYNRNDAGSSGPRFVYCALLKFIMNILLLLNFFYYFREESSENRIRVAVENDRIDSKYGFDRVRDAKERTGYLINMHTVSRCLPT